MKFYLIDDDIQVIRSLTKIIHSDFSREVIGYETNPENAIVDLLNIRPDIIVVDYLMPKLDGISVLKALDHLSYPHKTIMLSQVNDKEMMAKAYGYHINYFINKPLNKIEIMTIFKHLEYQIQQENKLASIASLINADKLMEKSFPVNDVLVKLNNIKKILSDLGIAGERGSKDIIDVCTYLFQNDTLTIDKAIDYHVSILKKEHHYSKKIIKQRMRRAINKGLLNMAYVGIEDMNSDLFVHYANALYQYDSVVKEINKIKGKLITGGNINLNKFIESLIVLSEF